MRKQHFFLILTAALASGVLSACGQKEPDAADAKQQDTKLKIVATIAPEYDWTANILGSRADHAELTLLLDNGVDLHSYQPTAADMMKIADSDLFLYVGGESDTWVKDALKNTVNPDQKALNLLELLGSFAKEEEAVPGMQEGEEHEAEEPEYDEHVWLSLKNAQLFCSAVTDALCELDPDGAASYRSNAEAYREKLEALDVSYQKTVDSAARRTLLFADRFPFRYLADDYGLDCYAAFAGCSAETEASFETVTYLAAKTDELKLPAVLTLENSDRKLAKTIIENTASRDQKILTLNSLQSLTSKDLEEGNNYLSVMESNLDTLKKALN